MESRGPQHDVSSHDQLLLQRTKNESISTSLPSSLDDPTSLHRDEKYLNRPTVYSRNLSDDQLPEETHVCLKNKAENIAGCHNEVNSKIHQAFELITFRIDCCLIQFWSACSVGKNKLLKTADKPFALGICDRGLCNYRKESERHYFHVDDKHEEVQDLIPVVRVYKHQMPEWTTDVANCYSKNHPLQVCAIRLNLHGYLVLPVFDFSTNSCVGVLEFITSSIYLDCAYEVQQIHRALKAANLTSPQAFDTPTSYVDCNSTQHKLDEIFKLLKDVCNAHKLPLAQTWAVSPKTSFVATERNIEMTCNSFNSICTGKVCMSTTGLPFYVHDLSLWSFWEVCKEHHLLKSHGVVGRALSSQGSCFCSDVTKLDEVEYSLVHNARMSGLTSCFAIYLHSIEHADSYVLEFFLPVNMKEGADLHDLVQKVKMHLKLSSFELGDLSSTEVIGTQMEVSQQSSEMQLDSKELLTVGEVNANIDSINAQYQSDFSNDDQKNWIKRNANVVTSYKYDVVTKQRRKHKMDSVTREAIQQMFGKPIREASKALGVSRSTLKRVCRKLNIPSWPLPHRHKKCVRLSIYVVVLLLVRIKRWSCSSRRHGFSAKWWICGKHNAFDSRSKLSIEAYGSSLISKPSPVPPKGDKILEPLYLSQTPKESDDFIQTANPNAPQANFDMLPASPKKNLARVSAHIRMLTVKATFENDMIKFHFPLSSGLLELKKQVAQRFKLKDSRLHLKYRDEDDDLILIACDTDLSNLTMSLSATTDGYGVLRQTRQLSKMFLATWSKTEEAGKLSSVAIQPCMLLHICSL